MAARTGPRAPTAAEAAEWQPATTVVGMHLYISLSLSLSLLLCMFVHVEPLGDFRKRTKERAASADYLSCVGRQAAGRFFDGAGT
jgi:hypothetical protein